MDAFQSEKYVINMGPQHPSVHGGMHLETLMDGEIVEEINLHLGYDHRSVEKIAESRTYLQFIPYTARLDYLSSFLPTTGYCGAVEKLMNIEVPERAEYIRVIMGELNRITGHLMFVGTFCNDLGATTVLAYCIREREKIMKMMEMTGGQRMISSYCRIGGVSDDLPPEFFPALEAFLDAVPHTIDELNNVAVGNEILQARLKNVGVISKEDAIAWSLGGPNLRACGVPYDIRKVEPYSVYDRFEFDVPTADYGDCWNRFLLRIQEIEQSARIIRQALEGLPEGDFRAKVPRVLKPAKGAEVYHRIEGAKGELGFYLLSDGTEKPQRMHVRAPSFINLMVLPVISRGAKFQDVICNIATLDPVLGECDR